MNDLSLIPNKRGHLTRLIKDLLYCGWTIDTVPEDGKIPRNGLKLILKTREKELRLRVYAYKVTSSGRSRPHERRVEITTTYKSGIKPLNRFRDVVLGIDVDGGKYVGIDSRRLKIGGPTHNASSFFDREGLSVKSGELLINPRPVVDRIFPSRIELHSFFDRTRLSEYLFNHHEIHTGLYGFGGDFSGAITVRKNASLTMKGKYRASSDAFVLFAKSKERRATIRPEMIAAVQQKDFSRLSRKISPEELKRIMGLCDEIGAMGEQAVLAAERRRLRKLGFLEQANKVERVSLRSVAEGYDIVSFEDDGTTPRFLEVKATDGTSPVVDISRGEWEAAKRHRKHYYLVRVMHVRSVPKSQFIPDPWTLEKEGLVSRTATGWRIDLRSVMKS
jgi:hypothetical protein